jgi:uncharacterized membrane protein (DUF485 family)
MDAKCKRAWEGLEISVFVLSIISFAALTVTIVGTAYPFALAREIFLGLAGVFASFFSAFLIAWIVERKANVEFDKRKFAIRSYYLTQPKEDVKMFLLVLAASQYGRTKYYKPYFVDAKLNFPNVIYNTDFLFQLEFLIHKNKLVDYHREQDGAPNNGKWQINGSDAIYPAQLIREDIKRLKVMFLRLSHDMQAQNSFSKMPNSIFSECECKSINDINAAIQNEESDSILLGYTTYEKFITHLEKFCACFGISIVEKDDEVLGQPIMDLCKNLPSIHNRFYDGHKAIRQEAEKMIKEDFYSLPNETKPKPHKSKKN